MFVSVSCMNLQIKINHLKEAIERCVKVPTSTRINCENLPSLIAKRAKCTKFTVNCYIFLRQKNNK